MNTFFTITNATTAHTNDRSERFETFEEAVQSAKSRIRSNRVGKVIILRAVALVEIGDMPIVVKDIQ
jgi:hypothetical protein